MDEGTETVAMRVASLLEVLAKERGQLLPALWIVYEEFGHIGPEVTEAVSNTMNIPYAEVYGVASFYALFDNPIGMRPLYVCTDVMCALQGSEDLLKTGVEAASGEPITIKASPCLGHCDGAPVLFDGNRTVRQVTAGVLMAAIRGGVRG